MNEQSGYVLDNLDVLDGRAGRTPPTVPEPLVDPFFETCVETLGRRRDGGAWLRTVFGVL